MTRFLLALCVAGWAHAALAQGAPADNKTADEYTALFNGKDLDGWEIFDKQEDFKVQDGIIHCDKGGGGQILYYTRDTFEDFELVVEWRVSKGGNSGVFLRAPKVDSPWTAAWEVQISNEQPPRDDAHTTGALYGYTAVSPRIDAEPEVWHTFKITCKGKQIQVNLDGKQIIDFNQAQSEETKDKPMKGFIGLQDSHGPEGTWIEYRAVKIKPL